VSKLRPRLSDLEWDPKYGPHLVRSLPIATGSHLSTHFPL
jgi:hypothetical protein